MSTMGYPLAMLIAATGMSYLYRMNVGLSLFFLVKICLPFVRLQLPDAIFA